MRQAILLMLQAFAYLIMANASKEWACGHASDYIILAVLVGFPAAWLISERKALRWWLAPVVLAHILVIAAIVIFTGLKCMSWPKF